MKFWSDSKKLAPDACRQMLDVWMNDDEDPSLEDLAYMMEGLNMIAAVDCVKRILEPADKMEDISE